MGEEDKKEQESGVEATLTERKLELYELALRGARFLIEKQEKDAEREAERRKEMAVPPPLSDFVRIGECNHPGLRLIHDYIARAETAEDPAGAAAFTIARDCLHVFASDGVVRCPACSKVVSTELIETGKLWEKQEEAKAL